MGHGQEKAGNHCIKVSNHKNVVRAQREACRKSKEKMVKEDVRFYWKKEVVKDVHVWELKFGVS